MPVLSCPVPLVMRSRELHCPLWRFEAFARTVNGSPTLLHCMGATLPTWLWVQHDEQLTDAGSVKSRQRQSTMVWYGMALEVRFC